MRHTDQLSLRPCCLIWKEMSLSFTLRLRALQQLYQAVAHQTWQHALPLSQTLSSSADQRTWHRTLTPVDLSRSLHTAQRLWNVVGDGQSTAVAEETDKTREEINPSRVSLGESLIFNGVPYEKIPIAHIKASYNNTIITVTDHFSDETFVKCSCGTEGFKNAKKSTSIAGQTVGIASAKKALSKDVKMVRILVRGIGPGRQAAIKGLQMGGLDVVSITDNTPVPHNGCRPRKARRL